MRNAMPPSSIQTRLACLSICLGVLSGCGARQEQSSDSQAFDELARKTSERAAQGAEPLAREGHALWAAGRKAEAINKYSEILRVDPGNAYGHFGLGMQAAQGAVSIDGSDEQLLAVPRASLKFYLDSQADRGGGNEAERRSAAQSAFAPIDAKLANALQDADGYDLHEGMKRIKKGNLWGFSDAAGRVVVEPRFQLVRNFSEGLAAAKTGDQWGYIDRSGKFAIAAQFDDALSFERGIGQVTPKGEQSGFYRYIDKNGQPTTDPEYFRAQQREAQRRDNPARVPPNGKRSVVGTFSGEEGGGSLLRVTFEANGTVLLSQGSSNARGKYKKLTLPFPEKGPGNIYYDIEPEGDYVPLVGFYDTRRDRFHLISGRGARDRLLEVGPHSEFTVPLDRDR